MAAEKLSGRARLVTEGEVTFRSCFTMLDSLLVAVEINRRKRKCDRLIQLPNLDVQTKPTALNWSGYWVCRGFGQYSAVSAPRLIANHIPINHRRRIARQWLQPKV